MILGRFGDARPFRNVVYTIKIEGYPVFRLSALGLEKVRFGGRFRVENRCPGGIFRDQKSIKNRVEKKRVKNREKVDLQGSLLPLINNQMGPGSSEMDNIFDSRQPINRCQLSHNADGLKPGEFVTRDSMFATWKINNV